jgi:hypothetical protein
MMFGRELEQERIRALLAGARDGRTPAPANTAGAGRGGGLY